LGFNFRIRNGFKGVLKVHNYVMHSQTFFIRLIIFESHVHAPFTLLEKLKCEFESENNRRKKTRGTFPNSQHFVGRGRARAHGWGLRSMTNELIIHTDLHKPNNMLVNV